MGSLSTGGGSSAIAASAHASCARHRHTDPLITGMSRSKLADHLGHPDTTAGIPEARWMRAMTFERLVRDKRFVSQLLTTAVGALGLARPLEIRRADCHVDGSTTAAALMSAHRSAGSGAVTILTGLAVPFVGMECEVGATPVKPDFAIVAPRPARGDGGPEGSWLILGDAKDYERVRTRIDDQRLLKGFLQVALGAESAANWSLVPTDMRIHRWGALAVPRNAFLQPEAVVECLDDHRVEVRTRATERLALRAGLGGRTIDEKELVGYVSDEEATFDPQSCVTCSLFEVCRSELRRDTNSEALLTEIGIRPEHRPMLEAHLDAGGDAGGIPASVLANVTATVTGLPQWTGQRRTDPVGQPGTVEVVLAKADAAALGIHGLAVRQVRAGGSHTAWKTEVFTDPQSPRTRTQVMRVIGRVIETAMSDQDHDSPGNPGPVHLVTPDPVTADVLVSIADSLAGVETSRLRWQRDLEVGRPALTFDGEPATVPPALPAAARLAVSFLLEADRARAMHLRTPVVDLRAVLADHVVAGGPAADAGRLDHLVTWAEADRPLDHRTVSDTITASPHTPGARLTNVRSDAIHAAQHGKHAKKGRGTPNPKRYESLIREELGYKQDVVDRAIRVLDGLVESKLRSAHRALEHGAQEVWRRRLTLRASDLVRFGRTSEYWRNRHVDLLDADARCREQLSALGNPQAALDLAIAAGTRDVARATVRSLAPLRVEVESRRITDGSTVLALVIDGTPCVEAAHVSVHIQKGSFKLAGLAVGELIADRETERGAGLRWETVLDPAVKIGSTVIVADTDWFKTFKASPDIAVVRPAPDTTGAPTSSCDEHTFEADRAAHRWCCRPHEKAEAETADWIADRRASGKMNPQTWPPIVDEDEFDISPTGAPTAAQEMRSVRDRPPADLTIDDID